MKIREIGATLHLLRYAGYDKEGKKSMEAKIGAVGKNCLPVVLDKELPSKSDEGIPMSLWRKLTIEEQEQLMQELQRRALEHQRTSTKMAIRWLAESVTVESLTPELAAALWQRIDDLQHVLKKAGHPKPAKTAKTAKKAPDDPHTGNLLQE